MIDAFKKNCHEFSDFIMETRPDASENPGLNPDWVLEMLRHLSAREGILSREWIRADYEIKYVSGGNAMTPPPFMWIVDPNK